MTQGRLVILALYGTLACVAVVAGAALVTRGLAAVLLAPGRRQWARTQAAVQDLARNFPDLIPQGSGSTTRSPSEPH